MNMATDKNYIVYSCKEMEPLVHKMCMDYPNRFRFESITFEHFKDGTPSIFINNICSIEGKDVIFFASFPKAIHKYDQLCVLLSLCESFINSLTIVLPFSPTGTMERVDCEGQVATANVDAWLLNSLPKPNGPIKVVIYDLHTQQNRFYIRGNALLKMATAMPIFMNKLINDHKNESITIAFPDDGSYKRFGKIFADIYPTIICGKIRDGDKRIVTIKEGNAKDQHVFIVDDLVQTGGTIIECKNALLNAGAKEVSAFVTHVIFPNNSWTKFVDGEGKDLKHFYCTNSFPSTSNIIDGKGPFTVLSLYPNILQYL